jgi:superfamily I DNA/RNA helicase
LTTPKNTTPSNYSQCINAILEVARGDNGIEDQKEERRLFYVAITRAKEDLYIYTKQKENSEFLGEVAAYTSSVPL